MVGDGKYDVVGARKNNVYSVGGAKGLRFSYELEKNGRLTVAELSSGVGEPRRQKAANGVLGIAADNSLTIE